VRAVVVCLMVAGLAVAGTVTHEVGVSPQDVKLTVRSGYTVVEIDRTDAGLSESWTTALGEVPGAPLLPVLSGNVLVPAGAEVEEVAVEELATTELGLDLPVYPAQPMRPLSQYEEVAFVEPDVATYSSDAVFPGGRFQAVPAGNKAGFRIAGFRWCPFRYHPASNRLELVTRARVTVTYRENAFAVPVLTPGQAGLFGPDVAGLVVNPQDVSRMAPPAAEKDGAEVDVVMFTNATLAPALGGLRGWLARKGYFTEIVRYDTLSTSGRDSPEKMREFLKMMFADHGLKYVILAGDYQNCPVRYGYLPYSTYDVPADMYYADLDGSWDANGNNHFGEMDGDSLDLFQDIYVGRLPFDDAGNADNFLRKDTTYEITPDTAYLNNVILPGEVLWSNIDFHGMIVNANIARMLQSRSPWEVDSGLNMSSSQVVAGLNAGRQHFHFGGHGARTQFGSTFSTSNLASLTNIAKPCVVVSMACDCGWWDDANDCLGEQFVNCTNGGAVATMLNARYGWGAPPCQGPNSNMNCQFYHGFLDGKTVGQAHGLARDHLRNESFSQMSTRWAMYTNTLQGDPTMAMWRRVPVELEVEFPDTVSATPQTVEAVVRYTGGEPTTNARFALTHAGELVARATSNSLGIAALALPAVEDTWALELTVTAPDGRAYSQPVAVRSGSENGLVVLLRSRVDDANGRLDPGEESDLYLVVENRGNSVAEGSSGELSSGSPYVTVVTETATYGDIAAGDTATGTAYRVNVSPDCPHGHSAELTLVVHDDFDGSWRSDFRLTVGLPHPNGGVYGVLDTGAYVLAVPGNGGIGTTQWHGEGFGWIYDKDRSWSNSCLMHGGLMLGTDTSWVADNYYGAPDWHVCPLDFAVEESVRTIYPPELGDKEFYARFSDASHPAPRNIVVDQRVYGGASPAHEDFIIYEYRIHNQGGSALEGLYTGVACDFRTGNWNVNDQYDYAGTDSARVLAYCKASPETTALGIRPIWPRGMGGWANCIFHNTHVNDGFTKAEKMGFMDGTLRQTTGTSVGNWHAMASSGPYTIPAGDSQIVAFVLVGGSSVADMLVNSDTALEWYDPPVGIAGPREPAGPVRGISVCPRIFTEGFDIAYQLERIEPVVVMAYDADGRLAARQVFTPATLAGRFSWKPELAPGVYFIRSGAAADKVLKLR
jgi:hypothetical protein